MEEVKKLKTQIWQRMKVEFIAETENDQELLIEITRQVKRKTKSAQQDSGSRSKRHPESDEGDGSGGGGE